MTQPPENNIQKNNIQKVSVLAKRRDFLRIAAGRKKWVSNSMIVQVAKMTAQAGQDLSGIRVGYTASKKVGNAVKRNRAKRRLREVVRQVLWSKGERGHDYVLIARPATLDMTYDQLIRDFSWCLKRLNQSNDPKSQSSTPGRKRGKADQAPIGGVKK